MAKICCFVDEANVTSAAQSFNRSLDWLKLRDHLIHQQQNRVLSEMIVYSALPPLMPEYQERREKKEKFLYWLRSQGFMVMTKNGSPIDGHHYKANVDVLMAIDAIEFAVETRPDVVILVTGDADFAHLAFKLRRRGIRVEVASVQHQLGNELRAAASGVIDLAPLFEEFEPLNHHAHVEG